MAETASSGKGDFGKRLASKALMPLVATAASAAAGYVAKKGPSFFEETVLPKLKAAASSAGNAVQEAPSRAKDAAGGAGDLAENLTSRAKETVGSGRSSGGNGNGKRGGGLSQDELQQHLKERAQARAERRKSSGKGS
jgi:hypothetical protein